MVEVMNAQYIRTARLKGMSFISVVFKHALRNALIAPFTVIMLQFPWLLTGVVIVEKLFNYKGFAFFGSKNQGVRTPFKKIDFALRECNDLPQIWTMAFVGVEMSVLQ